MTLTARERWRDVRLGKMRNPCSRMSGETFENGERRLLGMRKEGEGLQEKRAVKGTGVLWGEGGRKEEVKPSGRIVRRRVRRVKRV